MLKISACQKSMIALLMLGWAVMPAWAQDKTAQDSLQAGLSQSGELDIQRQAFVIARQAIASANSGNDLTGSFSLSGSDVRTDAKDTAGGFSSSKSRVGTVTLKKQIFDFGEADEKIEAARYGLDVARANYQRTEQQVILNILSAHLKVRTAQKALAIRQANEKRLSAQTQAEQIKLDAGTSTPTRLAEAEARLAKARSDTIAAETSLISEQENYQSLTGLDYFGLGPLFLPNDHLPKNIDDAEQLALQAHPSILSAIANEKKVAQDFSILRSSLLPKINFSVSAAQTDKTGTSGDKDEITSKLELSTPFLVTEGSRAASRRSSASLSQAKIQLSEARRTVSLQARKSYRDYQTALAQLDAVEAEKKAAELVAKGTASEVEYGLKTFLDQLDAEQALSDAELRYVQIQQSILLNGFGVLQATGQLTSELFLPEQFLPDLDSISDPASRYPYMIPITAQ